ALHRWSVGARGEVARLEAPLRVSAGTGHAGSAEYEAVQPPRRSKGGDGRSRGKPVGAQRDEQARSRFQRDRRAISARAAGRAGSVRSAAAAVVRHARAIASCRRSAWWLADRPGHQLAWSPRSNALATRATAVA